jgi:hypothetical protein
MCHAAARAAPVLKRLRIDTINGPEAAFEFVVP